MGMGEAAGGALGAQRYWLMTAPELLEKAHAKETQYSICGKKLPVKTAIFRDDKVLCEQCYEKEYGPKQKKEEHHTLG
jgi:hypothetical protein